MKLSYLSFEEKTLIEILFSKKISPYCIKKLDIKKFIKISSEHLLSPILFTKIREKKLDAFFEKDFINYLSQIHTINGNRNKELIKEAEQLGQILAKNK